MSSPSVFNRAPILRDEKHHQLNVDESYHQRNNHSRKRRPVDPPEEGNNLFDGVNEYDTVNNNNIKRLRASSPDDLLDTLSLRPPDPPAHSFCKKRKKEHDDDDNDSIGTSSHGGDIRYTKSPKFQDDERGGTSALTSISTSKNETKQLISSSSTKTDPPSEHDIQVTSTTNQQQETSEMENDMSIDDNSSSNSNSDISISEGSLQRAMYQAVFGRRRSSAQHQFHSIPSTISSGNSGNGIGCPYDAVDSKIEDLIRRSRLEAEIQGRKEVKQTVKGDSRVDQNGDVEDGMDTDGD